MIKYIHIQTVMSEAKIKELKDATNTKIIKDALIEAVDYYLQTHPPKNTVLG